MGTNSIERRKNEFIKTQSNSIILLETISQTVAVSANDAKTETWSIPTHTGYTPILSVCDNTKSTGIVCTVCNITSSTSLYCSFRNVTGTSVTVKPEVTVIYIKTVLL